MTTPALGHYAVDGTSYPGQGTAEEAVRTLLRLTGENLNDSNLEDTPARVVRAFTEMTSGYREDPATILSRVFEEPYDELVLVKGIPFTSLCSHHLLAFTGEADIGYLPGKVVGLSKLARLVDCFSKRLQVQERMTRQIAQAIQDHLDPVGVAVIVRASHSCMSCRGVRKPGAQMITSCMLGAFRHKPEARAELLSLCQR